MIRAMDVDPREALLVCAGDPRGDIAEGALWLAAEDCAEVDVPGALRVIETLAADLRRRLGGATKEINSDSHSRDGSSMNE